MFVILGNFAHFVSLIHFPQRYPIRALALPSSEYLAKLCGMVCRRCRGFRSYPILLLLLKM